MTLESENEVAQANIKVLRSFGTCDKQGIQCDLQVKKRNRHYSLHKKLPKFIANKRMLKEPSAHGQSHLGL